MFPNNSKCLQVLLEKILIPNRRLASDSQFYEAVGFAVMFEVPLEEVLKKVVCVFCKASSLVI